jgi:phenylalanyl-tRNA synthetase alpha chain
MEELLNHAQNCIEGAAQIKQLEELRVRYLGKNGEVTALMKNMKDLPPEERPAYGKRVNDLKEGIQAALFAKETVLGEAQKDIRLQDEKIDITLPGKGRSYGGLHPLTRVYYEIRDIFVGMGYEVLEGPEIEWDRNNFELLNIPKDHPSRDMQDTFYFTDEILLRTHTSPVQIRTMLSKKPPIRMICPGRVYRSDDVDATHSPIFNQLEGLVVDEGITFADLKGTLDTFLKEYYGNETQTRFRPGFFPFTEPSAEVYATCSICHGKGCPSCKGAGEIEVLGSGMVNPKVLANCGIDPEKYTGFAFGLGLDRIANIKYGVTDIRLLFENDIRFLRQFK